MLARILVDIVLKIIYCTVRIHMLTILSILIPEYPSIMCLTFFLKYAIVFRMPFSMPVFSSLHCACVFASVCAHSVVSDSLRFRGL